MFFDTHAHYDDERFDNDRDAVLKSLPEAGIGAVVNPGCTADLFPRGHCPGGAV